MTTCKYCGGPLYKKKVGPHTGLYCAFCEKYQQWIHDGPKFVDIPWGKISYTSKEEVDVIYSTHSSNQENTDDTLPWED